MWWINNNNSLRMGLLPPAPLVRFDMHHRKETVVVVVVVVVKGGGGRGYDEA